MDEREKEEAMKHIIVTTVCDATVRETWSLNVEEDRLTDDLIEAARSGNISALIDVATSWSVEDEVDDERNREVTGFTVEDPETCGVCGQPDNCGDCTHDPAERPVSNQ
jgi:hypothetical protein